MLLGLQKTKEIIMKTIKRVNIRFVIMLMFAMALSWHNAKASTAKTPVDTHGELRVKGTSYRLNDAPSAFIKSILEASSFALVDISNDSFAPIATSLYLTNTLIVATPALLSELY